jgi:hypothetical protein
MAVQTRAGRNYSRHYRGSFVCGSSNTHTQVLSNGSAGVSLFAVPSEFPIAGALAEGSALYREARIGFEPTCDGFANRCLAAWLPRPSCGPGPKSRRTLPRRFGKIKHWSAQSGGRGDDGRAHLGHGHMQS